MMYWNGTIVAKRYMVEYLNDKIARMKMMGKSDDIPDMIDKARYIVMRNYRGHITNDECMKLLIDL